MTKFSNKNLLIISLLFLVFLPPFLSAQNFSPVHDEITHLPSGYSYLRTGEIKLNPQHPPLIKMLAALPLLFLDLKFDPADPNLVGPQTDEWQFGRDFLFNNGIDRVFFWGRIPMILLSVLLGWYVYRWGRELFGTTETQKGQETQKKTEALTTETQNKEEARKKGERVGLIALFLYAFMPNIIAHSQFVTTDMGLTVFSFIALYYLWRYFQNSTKKNLALSGLALGLALGSKFSAVFLLPIFFILLIIYIYKKYKNLNWLFKTNSFLKIILPISGLSLLVMWALYFFPSDPLFYWRGLNTVYADHNPNFFYYLNGNFGQSGWWYYFLWAFMIKTPIPFLVILIAAIFYRKKILLNPLDKLFIFLPVAVFLFMASWKAHNIGVRYILPIYPFLILFVSGQIAKIFNFQFFPMAKPSRILDKVGTIFNKFSIANFKTILILVLGGWYLLTGITTYPDYLAYFSELVGGSNNGYKYLDDSNIEWGHDFKRLAEYQKENPDLKVLPWTNIDADKFYGIKNILSLNSKNSWLDPSGKYAVSVHAVIRTKRITGPDDQINWMDHKPLGRIGQSFFIYEFP